MEQEKKKSNKKIWIIVISILVTVCIVVSLIVVLLASKSSKELKYCYEQISNYNIENFTKKIDEHSTDDKFEEKAYNQLFKAIDEKINNIKNGQNDEKLSTMLTNLIKDERYSNIKETLQDKLVLSQGYSVLNYANMEIEQGNYEKAYTYLKQAIQNQKDKNQNIVDIATDKQNEIKDKLKEEVISKAQNEITNNDYEKAEEILLPYKDIDIQEITDLYNSIQNEMKQAKENKKAELLAKLDSKYDDMYNTTYISPKGIDSISRKIHLAPYLAIEGSIKTLYIDLGFQEDNWVFFNEITFNVDGELTTVKIKKSDVQKDTIWGDGIYEYIPLSQSKYANIFKLTEKIINGNEVKVRFTGDQYYTDYVITNNEKQGLRDIYELYKCYKDLD